MKKLILSLSIITGLALNSFAQDASYKVDASKSTLVWNAKKVTGEHKGNIPVATGTFSVSNKKLVGGTFELNVAGITVTDLTDPEYNGKLLGHLKSDDFFATDKFPKATFVVTKSESKGGDNYSITGNLTIKGITNPITFPAVVKVDGKTLTATGLITVDRTKFDIKFRSANFFENLGDKAIENNFTLDVKLVAVQ